MSVELTGAEIAEIAQSLDRFESLGDNCEFGFFQRLAGVEPGGLLRWAISPSHALISAIDDAFSSLYCFQNLEPSAVDMIKDKAYGLYFHSAMRSVEGRFCHDLESRKKIYDEEANKIIYLRDKLVRRLREASTIFIYKNNSGLNLDTIYRLKASIARFGSGTLLALRTTDQDCLIGKVEVLEDRLLLGHMERFAPYEKADDLAVTSWFKVLRGALELAPGL